MAHCVVALLVVAILASHAQAITIVPKFVGDTLPYEPAIGGVGGAAPPSATDAGLITVFEAAADWWEMAIGDPHTIVIEYGWDASTALASASQVTSSPQPVVYGKIIFDNDGSTSFFADPTPEDALEFGPLVETMDDYGGGVVNDGRVYTALPGPADGVHDLLSVAKHEIGHILGVQPGAPPFTPITAPRPHAGTVIPLADPAHFAVSSALMFPSLGVSTRKLQSAIDILAVAEHSGWEALDLDPHTPAPGPGPFDVPSAEVTGIAIMGTAGGWDTAPTLLPPTSFLGFAHHGLPTLAISEDALDPGTFEIEFSVSMTDPGGVAIFALDNFVGNSSGELWTAFEMILGTGLGVGFVPSSDIDGMTFLTAPFPSDEAGNFPGVTLDPLGDEIDSVMYDGGALPEAVASSFWMGFAVPDEIDGVTDGVAVFTLQQIPTFIATAVPEPGSGLMLALFSGFGLLWRRRR